MTVFDRTDVELAISHHKLPEGALYSSGVTACYASELSATIIVSGAMEYTPGKTVLSVDASPVEGEQEIFGEKIIIDHTPANGNADD